RDLVVRTQAEPCGEMFLRGPPAHVGADLTDEHQRGTLINALDGRQVYARDPKQGLARIKAGFVGAPLALPPTVGEHLPSTAIRKGVKPRYAQHRPWKH